MVKRRTILKRSIALGVAGVAGVPSGATAQDPSQSSLDSFIETEGTDFVVDGETVYFNGTNNFWLTDDGSGSEQRIDQIFELFDDMGINLVRTWAHGEAKEGDLTLQPEPGVHNEAALQLHDYLVVAAKEHGIRLILALVDNWEHEGGMLQYAEWTGGETRHHFYTDSQARDLYQNHVETMVTRENHISGVEYRNDPTIMLWELANEPRLERDGAIDGEFDGDEHRQVLGDWIADMSAYVKSLDSNHLVSTGSEGFYYGVGGEYPYDEWDGADYLTHHQIDTIDACSFHWYPDHWNMALDHGPQWIQEHVEDAHQQLDKPAYLGEFNVNIDNGLETRNAALEEWYDTFDQYDGNALLPWQVVLDSTQDHDGFQLYRNESGYIIENYADIAAEKSEGDIGDGTDGDDDDDTGQPVEFNAELEPSTTEATVGERITFHVSDTTGDDGWLDTLDWDFDDGTTASGWWNAHTYESTGTYTVALDAADNGGTTTTHEVVITVS